MNSTHKVETQSFLKCLTFCLFPKDVHVASSTTLSAQATACENNLSKHVITCQSNLPFCVDKEKENPAKPYRALPQASHGITPDSTQRVSLSNEEQKGEKRCMTIQTTTNRHGETLLREIVRDLPDLSEQSVTFHGLHGFMSVNFSQKLAPKRSRNSSPIVRFPV